MLNLPGLMASSSLQYIILILVERYVIRVATGQWGREVDPDRESQYLGKYVESFAPSRILNSASIMYLVVRGARVVECLAAVLFIFRFGHIQVLR
jgi:hypothetical protein